MVGADVGRDLALPLVPVGEQLLLVVEQLLVRLRRELEVGPLHDRVHGARLLHTHTHITLSADLTIHTS